MRQADIKEGEDYYVTSRQQAWGSEGSGYRATVLATGVRDPKQKGSNDGLPRTVRVRWSEGASQYLWRRWADEGELIGYVYSGQVVEPWSEHEVKVNARRAEREARQSEARAVSDRLRRELDELLPERFRSIVNAYALLKDDTPLVVRPTVLLDLLRAVRGGE